MTAIDFSDADAFDRPEREPLNVAVNEAVERATAAAARLSRAYLGASIVGHECARQIQYDWWCVPELPARVRLIFDRGHAFEVADPRSTDLSRVSVRAAGGARVHGSRRLFRGARRRNRHFRTRSVRRAFRLSRDLGMQSPQRQEFPRGRSQRIRGDFSALRDAGRALPALPRQAQSRAGLLRERRLVRDPPPRPAVRRYARRRSDRLTHRRSSTPPAPAISCRASPAIRKTSSAASASTAGAVGGSHDWAAEPRRRRPFARSRTRPPAHRRWPSGLRRPRARPPVRRLRLVPERA